MLTRRQSLDLRASRPTREGKPTAAHLLGNHHNARSLDGASEARDGKQFNHARKEVRFHGDAGFLNEDLFLLHLGVDVVEFSGGEERRRSKTK
jgi:hypothetical protein